MAVNVYMPYFDPDYDSLIERIHPPRVCVDNDTCHDCTLVKVDSANKNGILLEMVQVLTDLDLVISKSYISSDGGWFMDVFHVTDQLGNKITDENLILYIQQAMCSKGSKHIEITTQGRETKPFHVLTSKHTAIEITGTDQPGMMSEIAAVLTDRGCQVAASVAWTHNNRVACIIFVENMPDGHPSLGPENQIKAQLENMMEAHHCEGERWSVAVEGPASGRTHPERRLHQMMSADRDYEECRIEVGEGEGERRENRDGFRAKVTIEHWRDKGYSVVNIRSRDRPKLLFDTVCTLTDLQYVVFHAAVSSKGHIAIQEYYIRHKNGEAVYTECEKTRVSKCLVAATERRISRGLRLDISTENRSGLLSDITRAFRENGLSITRAEIGTKGEKVMGSFYVTDASGQEVSRETVENVRQEIGGTVLMVNYTSGWSTPNSTMSSGRSSDVGGEDRPRVSLGTMLWSRLEWLSSNFRPIKS